MLGQGLESLIPPQKSPNDPSQAAVDSSAVSSPASDPSLVPAAREQLIDPPTEVPVQVIPEPAPVPVWESASEPSLVLSPLSGTQSQAALPAEEEEKLLPQPTLDSPQQDSQNQAAQPSIRPELKKAIMGEAVFLIEVEKIAPNPNQPRRHFDEVALRDLGNSIREHGILQPLVVAKIETEVPGGTSIQYQLIAGERRLMASKLIGLERVPVIIKSLDQGANQSLELAIIENLQRENLNGIEMARAFARLQDEFRMTQREIATRLGKSRETVANTLRLLDLPFEAQEAIASGKITESHGRLLLSLKDPATQDRLFRDLVNQNLTTRELRAKVTADQSPRQKKESVELQMLQERLAAYLGAPVKINQTGESGRITINFYSQEELENIIRHLGSALGEESNRS